MLDIELTEKRFYQTWDILLALPQRWELDGHHFQAEEQVFAEFALL